MDRPAGAPTGDEHWAPDHIVLARRVLTWVGRLVVERDPTGVVVRQNPLEGMAAVEQRYPAWARGPFGNLEPEHAPPSAPGVYALVVSGVVRYVGASDDLARTFSARGLGTITRRDATRAGNEEHCRLNRLVTAEAVAGRTVDLYVLVLGGRSLFRRRVDEDPAQVAAQAAEAARGSWHLPT